MSRLIRVGLCVLALSLIVLSVAGCASGKKAGTSGGSTGATTGTTISEENISFSPSGVSVKVGETVEFVNNDSVPHEVDIDGKDLGRQSPGDSVTWTATKPGTYPYKCIIHPSMTGEIRVTK